ncbi:thioesterase II family protein [Streptomyces sp. NPDC054841]
MSVVTQDVELISINQPQVPGTFQLACFPSLVGSASFMVLSELLLPTVEVLALRYPDPWGGDELPRIAENEALVDSAFRALVERADGRPLALFGHRAGAWVAYRVAQRLERETGTVPSTLFVSARVAPPECVASAQAPGLSCRVVALAGSRDRKAPLAGVHAWARCTRGHFDVEVLPGTADYLDSSRRQVVNLIHDQLISLPELREHDELGRPGAPARPAASARAELPGFPG